MGFNEYTQQYERAEKVQTYLERFNEATGYSLELGEEIAFGGFGVVFSVTQKFSLKHRKILKYIHNGLVLKIIWTHHTGNGLMHNRENWEYVQQLTKFEIQVMNDLQKDPAAKGYTMPLLGSLEFKECDEPVFMLLMPRMTPLKEHLKHQENLKESDLVQICTDIAHALSICHKHEILHRDVKEGNIYMTVVGGKRRYVLGDFGICRSFKLDPTTPLTSIDNGETTDPALDKGLIEPGEYYSDIYSICSLILNLLKGKRGYAPVIRKNFHRVLTRGTNPEPRRRYANGSELLRALNALDSADTSSATVIPNNRNFRLARDHIRQGDYQSAEEAARIGREKKENGCLALDMYCRFRKEMAATYRGAGDDYKLRRLLHEANFAVGTANNSDRLPVLLMTAMINLKLGDLESFERTLKTCAGDGYAPAQYYYGYFMCEGQIQDAFGGSLYNEGIRYLLDAAKQGCIEANEYLLYSADLNRCTADPQQSIREIQQHFNANPTDLHRWKSEKRVPLLIRYM